MHPPEHHTEKGVKRQPQNNGSERRFENQLHRCSDMILQRESAKIAIYGNKNKSFQ